MRYIILQTVNCHNLYSLAQLVYPRHYLLIMLAPWILHSSLLYQNLVAQYEMGGLLENVFRYIPFIVEQIDHLLIIKMTKYWSYTNYPHYIEVGVSPSTYISCYIIPSSFLPEILIFDRIVLLHYFKCLYKYK